MVQDSVEGDLHLMLGWLMVVLAFQIVFLNMMCAVTILNDRSVHSRRKRRRTSRHDAIKLLCEAMKESSNTLIRVSENISKAFVEGRRDSSQQLYAELMKVEGLTSDEINIAHIRIAESQYLMIAFPSIPTELKADWVRRVIN